MLAQLLLSGLALGSIYALLALALVSSTRRRMSSISLRARWHIHDLHRLYAALTFRSSSSCRIHPVVYYWSHTRQPCASSFHPSAVKSATDQHSHRNDRLWIVFNNIGGWIWGYDPLRFPSLVPAQSIDVSGLRISPNSLATIGVAFGLMALLYLFFEFTREGTAMRAASMNRWAAQLMGIRVSRAATWSWALAAGVGGLAGLLVAPTTFLDFQIMVPVLLKASQARSSAASIHFREPFLAASRLEFSKICSAHTSLPRSRIPSACS